MRVVMMGHGSGWMARDRVAGFVAWPSDAGDEALAFSALAGPCRAWLHPLRHPLLEKLGKKARGCCGDGKRCDCWAGPQEGHGECAKWCSHPGEAAHSCPADVGPECLQHQPKVGH